MQALLGPPPLHCSIIDQFVDNKEDHLNCVGESFYQANLQKLTATRGVEVATGKTHAWAILVPDPGNAKDPKAVQVRIDNLIVGFLEHNQAAILQPRLLLAHKCTGEQLAIAAVIMGQHQLAVYLNAGVSHIIAETPQPSEEEQFEETIKTVLAHVDKFGEFAQAPVKFTFILILKKLLNLFVRILQQIGKLASDLANSAYQNRIVILKIFGVLATVAAIGGLAYVSSIGGMVAWDWLTSWFS